MELPPDPGPSRDQDAFDFAQGPFDGGRAMLARLMENAQGLGALDAERRRHLAIAVGAIGATWIAPVLARRRLKRRRARRRPRA